MEAFYPGFHPGLFILVPFGNLFQELLLSMSTQKKAAPGEGTAYSSRAVSTVEAAWRKSGNYIKGGIDYPKITSRPTHACSHQLPHNRVGLKDVVLQQVILNGNQDRRARPDFFVLTCRSTKLRTKRTNSVCLAVSDVCLLFV